MKRYTGQKALYEAINRSRGKVKRPNILERLKPALPKPESAVRESSPPRAEPVEAPVVAPPAAIEKPEPSAERPIASPRPRPIERIGPLPIETIGRPTPASAPTWLRPKPVQLNEGRLDVSVPYYIGIIAALGVVLVVLVAFKLGQIRRDAYYAAQGQSTEPVSRLTPTRSTPQNAATATTGRPQGQSPAVAPTTTPPVTLQGSQSPAQPTEGRSAQAQGDHWIVLARHSRREDLDAVADYYAKHGVELGIMPLTEEKRRAFAEAGFNANILPSGSGFLLVTIGQYDNPEKPGTDGYDMKQKIAKLGRDYKAPPGMGSFWPNYFSDAYGMKIK